MKSIFKIAPVLFALMLTVISCEEDEQVKRTGSFSLSFSTRKTDDGRVHDDPHPASIVITVKDHAGQVVLNNRKFELIAFGGSFVTESIMLETGAYQITSFIVLDGLNRAIYATPVEGSPKAPLVTDPLPIPFQVQEAGSTVIAPEVVRIESNDTPESFGYVSFGFTVVDENGTVPVGVKVELKVGAITYLDLNATVKVTAYSETDEALWSKDLLFDGPAENYFNIKAGYHHYIFTVEHFGIQIAQRVNGDDLLEGASGEVPLTYVLQGKTAPRMLKEQTMFMEQPVAGEWGSSELVPQSKVKYYYNASNRLSKMVFFGYSGGAYVEQRYFELVYEDGRVSKIVGHHTSNEQPYIEDQYSYYPDGRVSWIKEINAGSGVNTDVSFQYSDAQRSVNVTYSLSNGTGFNYQFVYNYGNIINDKTTRWGTLCNNGVYTFDSHINPLAHLGYVDIFLNNLSINNRTSESIQYFACAFPELIPQTYSYELTADGYPLSKITHYKDRAFISKTTFVY